MTRNVTWNRKCKTILLLTRTLYALCLPHFGWQSPKEATGCALCIHFGVTTKFGWKLGLRPFYIDSFSSWRTSRHLCCFLVEILFGFFVCFSWSWTPERPPFVSAPPCVCCPQAIPISDSCFYTGVVKSWKPVCVGSWQPTMREPLFAIAVIRAVSRSLCGTWRLLPSCGWRSNRMHTRFARCDPPTPLLPN